MMKKYTLTLLLLASAALTADAANGSWYQRAAHKLKNAINGTKNHTKHLHADLEQRKLLELLEDDVLTEEETKEEVKKMLVSGVFLSKAQKKHLKNTNPQVYALYKEVFEKIAAEATVEQLEALH